MKQGFDPESDSPNGEEGFADLLATALEVVGEEDYPATTLFIRGLLGDPAVQRGDPLSAESLARTLMTALAVLEKGR